MKSIKQIFDLSGKVAIVTGGSMGIGYGIVERLSEAGAKVVIADVSTVGSNKAANLRQQGREVKFIKTDVSSEKDIRKLISETVKIYQRLDILVNNAGIFPSKLVLDMDLAFWERTQAINLRGVFLGSREAAKVMVRQRRGSIINIASIDALHPSMTGLAAYDASKHGVWGLTKNLALELGKKKVRVNAIAPGGIGTEGVANMNPGKGGKVDLTAFTQKIPLGRFGTPDEIALAVLFLASDASSYMTGSIMVIDGGVLLS